jgi:hypothetical protein
MSRRVSCLNPLELQVRDPSSTRSVIIAPPHYKRLDATTTDSHLDIASGERAATHTTVSLTTTQPAEKGTAERFREATVISLQSCPFDEASKTFTDSTPRARRLVTSDFGPSEQIP